jgi:hypothetical protein
MFFLLSPDHRLQLFLAPADITIVTCCYGLNVSSKSSCAENRIPQSHRSMVSEGGGVGR